MKVEAIAPGKSRIFRIRESRFFNSVDSALISGDNLKSVSQTEALTANSRLNELAGFLRQKFA